MSKRILIAGNDPVSLAGIASILTALGYAVCTASGPEADPAGAVERELPDLALLDMGSNGSGVALARRILALRDMPVICLTSAPAADSGGTEDRPAALTCLQKPVEKRLLGITLEMALYKHDVEKALRRSDSRFTLLVDRMIDAFALHEVIPDADGRPRDFRFLEVNPAFVRILGLENDAVVGHTVREVFPDIEPLWLHLLARGAVESGQVRSESPMRLAGKRLKAVAYCPMPGQVATVLAPVPDRPAGNDDVRYNDLRDPLTRLPNRTLCQDRILQAIERSKRRPGYLCAILYLDIDRFHQITASRGYLAGDRLLQAITDILRRHVRSVDTLARIGEDEFVILLEEIKSHAEALIVGRRILKAIKEPAVIDGQPIYTSASLGCVLGPIGWEHPEDLLRNAAIARGRAKDLGGDRIKVFKWPMRQRATRVMDLETRLRQALELNELVLHYQPILDLAKQRMVGLEALIRWRVDGVLLQPKDFIPLAEETGLIIPIGNWVLHEACRTLVEWENDPSRRDLYVAVNLSARQFSQPDLVKQLTTAIRQSAIAPSRLEFEITESVIMANPDSAVLKLKSLRELGVRVSIDDFGTGYSSLSYLQRFPIDTLKIDRSFIDNMDKHENFVIVKTVFTLAQSLGLKIVAEGIENERQLHRLEDLGCRFGQGFLFSKALPKAEAAKFLKE